MQSQPTNSQKAIPWIFEPALAANLASAFVGALLGHIANNEARENQLDDSTYVFLRAVFRISDLLHLPSSNPVSTGVVARNFDHSGKLIFAAEACIVVVTLALAVLLFPLQQKLLAIFRNRGVVGWYAGVTALCAMPILNLAVMIHDNDWYDPHGSAIPEPGRIHFFILVLTGELIGLAILIAASRWRALSLSVLSLLSLLHCAFWMWAFWPRFATYFGDPKSPRVLIFFFPIAILAWLLSLARCRYQDAIGESCQFPEQAVWLQWFSATLASCALALLSLPNFFASLPISKTPAAQVIEISHGPCFGSCPVYTIRIHGNGLVESSGWWRRTGLDHHPRRDTQTTYITAAQFDFVMDIVRSARLPRLDQRAFYGCSDAPSFSLAVIANKETKRIVGDASCVGAKSGVQAGVVNAIAAIEKITGSYKWSCPYVVCD